MKHISEIINEMNLFELQKLKADVDCRVIDYVKGKKEPTEYDILIDEIFELMHQIDNFGICDTKYFQKKKNDLITALELKQKLARKLDEKN